MSKAAAIKKPAQGLVRCAIYTRKSTEEGLQQDFNSLDAQRESAEAYVASQKTEGWVCLAERYDDGGFTGGNMERPALQRLIRDIQTGRIDCVVVYKVDRLSRSLLDFARMMETFDKNKVSFVSVTQHFNTTHSMGRLTLNILLSFAQFEREIISERTRDKIAAARRRGKFMGGRPMLGYDLVSSPAGPRLIVNEHEAARVRSIFELYLKHESLGPTLLEIRNRGWTAKSWLSRHGKNQGGRPFDRTSLFRLLTNVIYVGKVTYRDEVHPGEHQAIVDGSTWQRVQTLLQRNGRTGGALVRNRYGALLKGILRCAACQCTMGHTYTVKKTRRYRYYVCMRAQKLGRRECPSPAVPAGDIEKLVVDQIRRIGQDPSVLAETVRQARVHKEGALAELQAERLALQHELAGYEAELRRLTSGKTRQTMTHELAEVQDRARAVERRITEVREQILAIEMDMVDQDEVRAALTAFDPVWGTLSPREQARIIRLLVERVDYDGTRGTLGVTFRPNGIKTLASESEEAAA